MPLITCPDCQNSVSDAAPACPHCGRPLMMPAPPHPPITQPVMVARTGGVFEAIGFLLIVAGIVFSFFSGYFGFLILVGFMVFLIGRFQ